MADTKHDIWNDDDGEGELKARSARKRRRTGLFLLVFGVVLAVVLVAAYRGGTGFDALRRLWSYQDGGTTETGAYPAPALELPGRRDHGDRGLRL